MKRKIKETIARSFQNEIALIHGDAQPKNILVKKDRFYVLDWEVVHYGDPAYDIGCLMAHYLLAGMINFPIRKKYFQAIKLFFKEYEEKILFKNIFPIVFRNAISHFPPILFGRVAGTYKIEFITPTIRESVQRVVHRLLFECPNDLSVIFRIIEEEEKTLTGSKPFSRDEVNKLRGSKLF